MNPKRQAERGLKRHAERVLWCVQCAACGVGLVCVLCAVGCAAFGVLCVLCIWWQQVEDARGGGGGGGGGGGPVKSRTPTEGEG